MSDAAVAVEDDGWDQFPFDVIDQAIADGNVIPFLGAGASMERRRPKEEWSVDNNRFGPNGSELAKWLASKSTYPNRELATDLARVAQFADSVIGRRLVADSLERVFRVSLQSSDLHHYLASFERPLLIMTTNYDSMLEAAFDAARRPYHLLVQTLDPDRKRMWLRRAGSDVGEQVDEIDLDLEGESIIYKIHGSCWPDEAQDFLISEDDYLRFLQRMIGKKAIPLKFAEPMKTRQFLFIGYGLADWNLRLLLHQLKEYVKGSRVKNPSWAIMHDVGDVDRRLWHDRDVQIFEVPLADFVRGMIAARDERRR